MKLLVSGSGETVKLLEYYDDVEHKLGTIHAQNSGIRVNSMWE